MSLPDDRAPSPRALRGLSRDVWALGLVSLFMDASSELVHALLPLLLSSVLGASMAAIGLLEGVAEATAAVTKAFSGTLSDALGRRKALLLSGYGLSALTKPVFPLAGSYGAVFAARFLDRVGKGIRGAPRDALIADVTPRERRGAAYGLRQALDSVGAVVGPLLAIGLVPWLGGLRPALWFATIPAALCVLVLAAFVREPRDVPRRAGGHAPLSRAELRRLPRRYWLVVVVGVVFTLARFSEAFLILRARDVGLSLASAPLVMVVMSTVYAASAYPAGLASDRVRPRALLLLGLLVLIAADALLAAAHGPAPVLLGAALWGLHMGVTQGLLSKLVAAVAPAPLRGSAFGLFHLASGLALLAASLVAGELWSRIGAPATFLGGATFAALAAVGLALHRPGDRTVAAS